MTYLLGEHGKRLFTPMNNLTVFVVFPPRIDGLACRLQAGEPVYVPAQTAWHDQFQRLIAVPGLGATTVYTRVRPFPRTIQRRLKILDPASRPYVAFWGIGVGTRPTTDRIPTPSRAYCHAAAR